MRLQKNQTHRPELIEYVRLVRGGYSEPFKTGLSLYYTSSTSIKTFAHV